ncbi:MAG: 3-oxoacyl-ACP reductase [Planctomycetaceae bacterium]|nr:MAG: 3-oxoacyl-ACP reductase [Planctomycetaceae bacterium]
MLAQKCENSEMEASFGDLSGQVVVVTGASRGIGQAIAVELARAGARLIVHYAQHRAGAELTAEWVTRLGSQVRLLACDFWQQDDLHPFVSQCWEQFGVVTGWVNNAGIDLLTGEAARWDYARKLAALWQVDVRSTVLLSKEAGLRMLQQPQGGVILTIGWDQAERGMEGDSGELFATAKNAIMGFTRSLAVSLAPRVRVNCIAPGWIRTAWGAQAGLEWQQRVLRETPLQRWGTPQDIAYLARFLLSPHASYLTGQVIFANGGAER